MLAFNTGGGSISLGQTISAAGAKVTFDKPNMGMSINNGVISIKVADFKVTKIEGKCQVFLVGQDPYGRISTDAAGVVMINPYVDPHAPLEIAAAASSATPEVAEAESASSKIASSALPESASASSSSAQSSQEDNVVEESKVTFMSTISHYIEILKAASGAQDDSASAGAPTYSTQDINDAGINLSAFATNNL